MSKSLVVFLSSLKMTIATFMSRILGLIREQVMAHSFGASGVTDAFLIAYRIPNLLRDLFAEGAFSSAFVPTFIEQNQKSHEEARKLLWSLFILLSILTLFLSGLIIFWAAELIQLFAPSFEADSEKFQLTVRLTQMMAPFLTFVSIAALFMGALNSLKIFFIPSLAPAFFNVTMILCMLLFPTYLIQHDIHPIYALGIGVFFGGLVQAIVQIPLIIKKGYGPTKPDAVINPTSKKVFKLLGPGLVGFAATQINLLVTTILASGTVVGAVSWLNYAFRLFQLPVGILSVSVGNSNLVHFAEAWKNNEQDRARELLASSYFLSMMLVFSPMIGMIVFADHIVQVVFERGAFTSFSTQMTAKALLWYALGLPFYSVYKILVPTFYAIGRQKIPVYISMSSILVNIIFCLWLTPIYGYEVLAIGTTLSMFLNAGLQIWIIHGDLCLAKTHFFNWRFSKLLLALAITLFVSYYFKQLMTTYFSGSFMSKLIILSIELSFVVGIFTVLVYWFGERSAVVQLVSKVKNRFQKK